MAIPEAAYQMLTGDDEGRVCRDIPESACNHQPGNFLRHVVSLSATKTGDGLADPKLVLSWLLVTLGAPAGLVGLLVPIREAGALVPQLLTAGAIRALPRRKYAWALGSVVQGLAVLGMAAAAVRLEGAAAGWTVLALLLLFALARSVCSVSYKDVLGKTVSKATRGSATGAASSLSAALVLLFGLLLATGILEPSVPLIAAALAVAGALWLLAAAIFVGLAEEAGATEGGRNAADVLGDQLGLLRTDVQLRRFIGARALLLATALAPPYVLALAGRDSSNGLGTLGPFVVASSLAAISSGYLWGRLADRSSRRVLLAAALLAAAALGAISAAGWILGGDALAGWLMPSLLFALMVAYQGVRVGRSTHIVDMASEEKRAAYTALSNTAIGVLLLVGGTVGWLAGRYGEETVLALFAVFCVLAALVAAGLEEVQQEEEATGGGVG
ncbi:MAG: MFS transporter [Acidobacteria bacterium]|nr:MAG: MFS transporter [Acidobacteriota bacterium]REK06087.1 MAG: MFS transporter [Acidobacteriota bacterium]